MEDDKQPQRSRFTDELLKIQQDFMADTQEPALLGSPEFDNEPRRGEPSPLRTLHDPVMLSFEVGDAQPDMMGSSLAPSDILQTAEEASGPTPRILLPQGHFPMDDSATSPAEGTVPAAVSPGDIRSQEVESLTVAPSDITTSAEIPEAGSRHLPDRSTLFSERQYASLDNPADMTISEDENEASDTQHGLPDNEPKEFTVTLPFPANQRPFYDAMIMNSRADIESFCSVFSNEVLRTPKPSAVHKIEALFLKLLDVCDYPPELDAASWDAMSPKEVQKYLYESNAKYALIWDMLDLLRELPMKVLIVARSERLLRFLEALVVAEGYSFSRTGLQDMEFRHATSPIKIVLVLPDQALLDDPSDFELVFGFDFEFKRSVAAKRLALLTPAQKHPMVLSLVLTHSLEHLDLGITDKDPDIPELDRKNALVIALTKIRGMVVNPEMGRTVPPHKIAQHFANLLGGPADPFPFEPIELPDSILDVYLDATQPQERGFADEEEDINTKKRKLQDDFEEVEAKRQKLSALVPIVDINRVEALSPLIRCLGVEVLDEEDTSDEVTVPRALLKVMESKVNDQQKALEESRYREEELKRLVANLSRRNDEFSNTINTIHAHHRAAIEERSKFERERDSSEQKAKSLEARLQAAEEEKAKLVAELVEIKAAPAPAVREPGQGPTAAASEPAAASDLEKALEASEADIERYKKRYENSERDHDYTRQAYQNASRSAEELANENRELAAQVKDLTHKASENLRAIHETNVKSQVSALGRVNDELAVTLKEREWELDRLREELKVYKARRETRQSSVPRSPRMGVMSPRTGRAVQGGASRGSSPVQLETPQNHRWQHLRE
ncbi:uncharacterized protein DNG_01113 [Cephalotrichum gorgonifer]|uniref:HDA1 complex subunit n=1 Tax=Cephalotrichum gorgonifer TaxID=2041049 RepID=A0AAE8MSC6_9PEZI|nr:uncharacterized protein DNG_01113 [Cephalotrichum gorgonifer]